jgi:hypothetical protein
MGAAGFHELAASWVKAKMQRSHISDETQEGKILAVLEAEGGWVPAPQLARISLQYCARLYSLRKRGIEIENRVEVRDGVRHGFYRLRRAVTQIDLIAGDANGWRDPEECFA